MQVIAECRKQKVGPRHPKGAKYCPLCCHYSLTSLDGVCQCCNNLIIKNDVGKHHKTKKTLDHILDNCKHLIDNGGSFPIQDYLQPGWHIRIESRTHWVPIIWLIKYAELPGVETVEGKEKWEEFINSSIRETRLEMPSVVIAR